MDPIDDQMLYVSFNQDCSAFAVGTERGFRIYNAYPYKEYYERIFDGGIGIVEMLYKSNILALVGGGKYPKHSRNKIIIWDDNQGKVMAEMSFTTYIKNVKMKREKIFIVCDTKIYVFNLLNFQNIDTVETYENSKGIISITYDPLINLLAFPDKSNGFVKLKNYDKNETILIKAHNSKIANLAISPDGHFICTASEKGTFLRIFRTQNGLFLNEYKIGTEKSEIYSISFDQSVKFLSCSTSTGTIHIYSMESTYKKLRESFKEPKKTYLKNNEKLNEIVAERKPKSFWDNFSFLSIESSWAEFKIPESKSISAFHSKNEIIVISSEGRYYLAKFDPLVPGDCVKVEEYNMNLYSN